MVKILNHKGHEGPRRKTLHATWIYFVSLHPPASYRRASIGSIDAARRAGYSAAPTAIVPSKPAAVRPELQLGIRPAKKSGIGNIFTNAQNPKAIPSPIPPLNNAIIR